MLRKERRIKDHAPQDKTDLRKEIKIRIPNILATYPELSISRRVTLENGSNCVAKSCEKNNKVIEIVTIDSDSSENSEVKLQVSNSRKSNRLSKAELNHGLRDVVVMLEDVAKKRKSSLPSNGDDSKKAKMSLDSESVKKKEKLERCLYCRQFMSSVKCFIGDPGDAVSEDIMLCHSLLRLDFDSGDIPQHKLTDFSVYDDAKHLCLFDTGLVEKNVKLWFSGCVKPIFDENPDRTGGVAVSEVGPILEWWITGFDGGEKVLFGFSTEVAEYILMNPSEDYAPLMTVSVEKAYLSKIIIEFLEQDSSATYEDLINKIQVTTPPEGVNNFTEDTLLRHAQFIMDQISSYDDAADPDENLLITTPCVRALIELAGVTLGQRRQIRRETTGIRPKPIKKKLDTKATTTPLVREIFENFFVGQIDEKLSNAARRRRCGVCEACQQPDCGKCSACKNKVKFGGTGTLKQACLNRRCPNISFQEDADDDSGEETDVDSNGPSENNQRRKTKQQKVNATWISSKISTTAKRIYYSSARVNKEVIKCGDYVCVTPDDPSVPAFVARVIYMWEDTKNMRKLFHAHWFSRNSETILGETAHVNEVFMSDSCEETLLESIMCKCEIIHKPPPDNWSMLGGMPIEHGDETDEKSFFYQKWYNSRNARFEDPPDDYVNFKPNLENPGYCPCCATASNLRKMEMVSLGKKIDEDSYESVRWNNIEHFVGGAVFLYPEAFKFAYRCRQSQYREHRKNVDEELYPEYYRKGLNRKSEFITTESAEPFKIGYINEIICDSRLQLLNVTDVKLLITKLYRPENTHQGINGAYKSDFHMLYWSDEITTVSLAKVAGKCVITYLDMFSQEKQALWNKGPEYFYFTEAYNWKTETFEEPPMKAQLIGNKGKGKGKGKGQSKGKKETNEDTLPDDNDGIRPLRTMDVFAGCGGLSEGFHQVGISDTHWAIEIEDPAAHAFRKNNPKCTVFCDDCNTLLKLVMDGEKKNSVGQRLPQKGDVELLCGGPPCQGFSGMNRFTSRQYSQFKNSLIVSYLSYCDYYRPRFFLLENVRNFVSFKRNMVLKLTMQCLIRMGYQCTFGVLQAGNFGVPQTRRRAFILAAAPGEKLPLFPEPRHAFSYAKQLNVVVDNQKYFTNVKWTASAPYREVNVRDSLCDLPPIRNGAKADEIPYNPEFRSHYQRILQGETCPSVIRDHVCKDMNPLVAERISRIPAEPFADWRDLPNIVVKLSDGTYTKKLLYTHRDLKNGESKSGDLRGVCSCAEMDPCDPSLRQHSTLIPWCLPHTGNRHCHWSGLYGRLNLDSYFKTTITNPEPMGKQGTVLHPDQHRVISVRECARSQGFPDSYRFYGTILDRHKQIGNAVPPPLAAAIGAEIKKCVIKKVQEKSSAKKV